MEAGVADVLYIGLTGHDGSRARTSGVEPSETSQIGSSSPMSRVGVGVRCGAVHRRVCKLFAESLAD